EGLAAQRLGRGLRALAIDVDAGDRGAFAGEALGHRLADALGSAADDGGAVLESMHERCPPVYPIFDALALGDHRHAPFARGAPGWEAKPSFCSAPASAVTATTA